ncbi:hypothetical protein DKP78_14265, partial [Enterococcus faecium]
MGGKKLNKKIWHLNIWLLTVCHKMAKYPHFFNLFIFRMTAIYKSLEVQSPCAENVSQQKQT